MHVHCMLNLNVYVWSSLAICMHVTCQKLVSTITCIYATSMHVTWNMDAHAYINVTTCMWGFMLTCIKFWLGCVHGKVMSWRHDCHVTCMKNVQNPCMLHETCTYIILITCMFRSSCMS